MLARQMLDELIVEPPERPFAELCRGGDGPGHCGRLAHRGKVAEADPIAVGAAGPGGHLQREPGLPCASRAVQGKQPRLAQQPGDSHKVLIPPDEAGHRQRQYPVHCLIASVPRCHRVAQDVLLHAPQGR